MIQVEDREAIRRAYFVEHKSIRAIARELQHGRNVIRFEGEQGTGQTKSAGAC